MSSNALPARRCWRRLSRPKETELFGGSNQEATAELQVHASRDSRSQRQHAHGIIDGYKLLQQIGEGGMGSVWMAEQEKPVRRRVALKLIKAGMDSKNIVARFEAERQALAMMDHQNIAKVLDAGTADDGRPYFAMELVRGIPFSTYCDKNKLTVEERLGLFIPVCRAIQHAHQKGIIHRDLKPSNVLVTLYDGNPVAKVIDFGLAKAPTTPNQADRQDAFYGIQSGCRDSSVHESPNRRR